MNDEMNKDRLYLRLPFRGIIYNETVKLELQIADEWLQWLLNEHIADIIQTKCFFDYKVVRLLDIDDSEGPTYAIQYFAESKTDYNRYMELHAAKMEKISLEKWGGQLISFKTVMEVLK